MSDVTVWKPIKELEAFSKNLSNFFEDDWLLAQNRNSSGGMWTPAVEISEDSREYTIAAELPEMSKDKIKLNVEKGVLTMTGERESKKTTDEKKYYKIERYYGNFLRSFALPDDVDSQKIRADYKEGVLNIHIPKSENAKPKSLQIPIHY